MPARHCPISAMRPRPPCTLAIAVLLLGAGCESITDSISGIKPEDRPPSRAEQAQNLKLRQAETVMMVSRQSGWRAVMRTVPLLEQQPADAFPGIAAYVHDLQAAVKEAETNRLFSRLEADRLGERHAGFWPAWFETGAGDPAMLILYAGLLKAAGETVRSDRIMTLALRFGRLDEEQTKIYEGLRENGRLLIRQGQRDMENLEPLRKKGSYSEMAEGARAALAVWSKNPDAWAELTRAQWGLAGRPGPTMTTASVSACLSGLRRADPLYALEPEVVGREPDAVVDARRLWGLMEDPKSAADLRTLEQFSVAAQEAGLNDLALVARGLLAGSRGGYARADEDFVRTLLLRYLPTESAAAICQAVFSEGRKPAALGSPALPAKPGASR